MALKKSKKSELINAYSEAIGNSKSMVYVSFKGLSVKKQELLRKKLYSEDIGYTVVKKTLWNIAADKSNYAGEKPVVASEMAVIHSKDEMSAAREAFDFAKANKGLFAILGGVWGGEYRDAKYMTSIATIPSREVLISQIAFLLKSPMQKLAIGISEVAKKKA